jgi:methionyl-tRNA synthetase
VLWARDLVAEVDRDVARFYLSLSAPEHSRTNFSRESLLKVAAERPVQPWNGLAAAMAKLTAEVGDDTRLPVGPGTPALAAAMINRFNLCFELPTFSMTRAADLIVQNIARLRGQAERAATAGLDRDALRVRVGDLFLQLRALVGCMSPVLVDLAARTGRAGGFTPAMSADSFTVTHTTAFAVPSMDLWATPNHDD